jgi:hypothetical protein
VELEEDLPGGVYVLQPITEGGTFHTTCWSEELFGGPDADRDRHGQSSDADPEEVAQMAAERLAEELGGDGDDGLQVPPPEPGSTKEWALQMSFLRPDLVGDQFADAAKKIGQAAGEGFWESADDGSTQSASSSQPTQTAPVQEECGDVERDVDRTTEEVGLVREEDDVSEDDADEIEDDADAPVCGFPTPNGPCQNEVEDPDTRCWIDAHQQEDEAARLEAQAAQAETIDEYPGADEAMAVADGGVEE